MKHQLSCMIRPLLHRGPDAEGIWLDAEHGIGLGHRRLSIVDISSEGNQPMVSRSDRWLMVYNGEVYNFREIRTQLENEGISFRGHSDSEVILAAVDAWGIHESLKKFVGMFAIALWDRKEQALTLVRDRMGEKPLYYGWSGGVFMFGSELKALRAHPQWEGQVDRGALSAYMRYVYIPAPLSIYQGIRKLIPGTYARIAAKSAVNAEPELTTYWSLQEVVENGATDFFKGSALEAVDEFERMLKQTLRDQMVADVPLGAFLSGGIDSATIVALMQSQSDRPIRTFTIGFHEQENNEAGFAEQIARHLGTEHTELYMTPGHSLDIIPKLPLIYDEPFADSSQLPTVLLSEMTRRHVTVSLSGDGGDELLGGYGRYRQVNTFKRIFDSIPYALRNAAGAALLRCQSDRWAWQTRGRKLLRLGEMLRVRFTDHLFREIVSLWWNPEEVVLGASEVPFPAWDRYSWPEFKDFRHTMMYIDMLTYLPDDIMVKVDRASMAASLESRAPYLDHRLIEFAWRLPVEYKIRKRESKWLLRQVLDRHVPRFLMDRPKQGFKMPMAQWMRGPLREWAESLLDISKMKEQGYLNVDLVHRFWNATLAGAEYGQGYMWPVLVFQSWLDTNERT